MKKFLLILFAFSALSVQAQNLTDSLSEKSLKKEKSLKGEKQSVQLKRVTRVLTLATFSDVFEAGDFDGFIENHKLGFEINYTKQKMSKILSKGISAGIRPVSTIEENVSLLNSPGVLKVKDQIVHAHITLRFSPLKFSAIQPYVEIIGGAQGILLTSEHIDLLQENATVKEVVYFDRAWSYGYSAGVRAKLAPHFFLDLRYARVLYRELGKITEVNIEDDGEISYSIETWIAPPGYLRAGVSFSY
jgi:hypothetical protein